MVITKAKFINVTGVNDAPTAVDDGSISAPNATVNENSSVDTDDVTGNDSDPDTSDVLSVDCFSKYILCLF